MVAVVVRLLSSYEVLRSTAEEFRRTAGESIKRGYFVVAYS